MDTEKPQNDDTDKGSLAMEKRDHIDPETQTKKIPYPKSVFFIVSNEFCERFSYYGMRTILSIYLTDILLFQENTSKIIFHVFAFLVYFFPTLGAMIADSWLGKFKTITYLSFVYAIGSIMLSLAATPPLNIPQVEFTMVGLFIIALGTGGIKPCVSAFGGDQFKLPEQEFQLATFFSMFYFSINAGSLLSTALTPILREDIHCFGDQSCYSLAFAVPGVLMIVSIVIFVFGRPLYKVRKPEGNMVIKVSKCITTALKTRSKSSEKKEHWLDYSEETYGKELVTDIKSLLRVLVLYVPLPVFWALFDQQATGWTFQARRMDGDIGFYTILPDQMQVINPLLILVFIPLFQYIIYPAMNKINLLTTPLKRLGTGGVLVGISFLISASISLALEAQYPKMPEVGIGHLRIYNNRDCNLSLKPEAGGETININKMDYYENIDIEVSDKEVLKYLGTCGPISEEVPITITELKATGYYFRRNNFQSFEDDVSKHERANPKVRTLMNLAKDSVFEYKDKDGNIIMEGTSNDSFIKDVAIGKYKLYIDDNEVTEFEFRLGGVYVILAQDNNGKIEVALKEITAPNSIHMLWLIPQYIIITMGEIMYSITGLEFSYSQAPSSMKSVLQACWLLTTAVGNLIVVIIEAIDPFENQSANFFLYAGLMIADMIIFAFMAMKYQYVEKKDNGSTSEKSSEDKSAIKEKEDT